MSVDVRREIGGDSAAGGIAVLAELSVGATTPEQAHAASKARERLSWFVLWGSLATFCGVALALVLGIGWYREQSLATRTATLQVIHGTVLYQNATSVRETVWSNGSELMEGDRIRTASDAQAFVQLPDGSNLTLWPGTTLEVRQLRASRFNSNRSVVVLLQTSGHTRVEVALSPTLERRFEVLTPHAQALLREGSYRVELGPTATDLAVREGSASVTAADQTVEILRRERTIVSANAAPSSPTASTRNLIRNGDFTRGFEGWQQGSRNDEDRIAGQVSIRQEEGRYVVRMVRQGSQKHGETFLHQTINRDVTDDTTLLLTLDVRVMSQTLGGGGWRGSEYPALVRMRYRDAYGSEAEAVRGFYVRNPEGHPTLNGVQVTANQWLTTAIDLFDEKVVYPRPAYLMWIEVEGSGWDFESFVTGIQLEAE